MQDVSIRAPAWGATIDVQALIAKEAMFQSARPRGARLGSIWPISCRWRFNPRARVGRDKPNPADLSTWDWFQSARPRGARHEIPALGLHLRDRFNPRARVGRDYAQGVHGSLRHRFNPRARVGRDSHRPALRKTSATFQSARPRGARRGANPDGDDYSSFNPRARVGRDPTLCCRSSSTGRFNPRARVGRDQTSTCTSCLLQCFNPRARVGRDP